MEQSGFRVGWRCVPGGARGGHKYRQRPGRAQTGGASGLAALLVLSWAVSRRPRSLAQSLSGPIVVYNAGSLARPFKELLDAFRAANPGVIPAQENSGSLEAARKLTELHKIPDVLAVADYNVIDDLLRPKYATWYANFARNAMVIAYTDRSIDAATIDSTNWWRVLLKKGVRAGHSDPALDPNGYRTLIVLQLAERYYREPGLAQRLDAAMPPKYQRPKEADLTALLQAGELDYAWTYRSLAETNGLKYVSLPKAIDLSDPLLAQGVRNGDRPHPGRQPGWRRFADAARGTDRLCPDHPGRGAASRAGSRLRALRPVAGGTRDRAEERLRGAAGAGGRRHAAARRRVDV